MTPDDDDTLQLATVTLASVVVRDWAGRSSIGQVRARNEDSWGESERRIFAVADGMGGLAGGATASTLAIAGFLTLDPSDGWLNALRELNRSIRARCDLEGLTAAGTTLVGVVVERGRCVTMSIGDSRIYRRRAATVELITTDHNLGTLRSEEGLDPRMADERGRPSALTAYLGNPLPDQRIDVGTISVKSGDRLLLCSDGVHGQLAHDHISQILIGSASCAAAAGALVEAADHAGGRDNATALVLELEVVPE